MKRVLMLGLTALVSLMAAPAFGQTTPLEPMRLWWNSDRLDNATVGDNTRFPYGAESPYDYLLPTWGYVKGGVGIEFCAIPTRYSGRYDQGQITRLELWYSVDRTDFMTLAGERPANDAAAAGYSNIYGTQGYIFTDPQPGTVPVDLYWSPDRLEHYTLSTETGKNAALAAQYVYVRTLGYAFPHDRCDGSQPAESEVDSTAAVPIREQPGNIIPEGW